MVAHVLSEVLEATGYLSNGEPAHGVYLGEDARIKCQAREFSPDAMWRSDSALTVYFKSEPEVPAKAKVAQWHQEIWNQGFAPLLWVVSPHRIDLYNGFARPRKAEDAAKHRLGTFRNIERELDDLDSFAGRLAMETGRFWQQASSVDRRTSVDRQLLDELAKLERSLVSMELDHSGAQGLIGRSIFTQYLIDREIITEQILENNYGHRAFRRILRDPSATVRLFDWLRETFNGDMFPSEETTTPNPKHLNRVAEFLEGVNSETGQTTLFPYQFDVIPVELISLIYEQFVHADTSTHNSDPGNDVFYTRLPLVSLVLDEITEGLTGEETVLDLTCGSGVFLVEALRRLVDLRSNGQERSRELIRSTLYGQIYGVDISEAAVRVAAFSLYLAALELDPDPRPPQALKFEPLIGKTLIVGDAWDVESKKFDMIVGNPPWSYRGELARAERQGRIDPKYVLQPRGESLNFVLRAMDFATEDTRFGLVLSALHFFSLSNTGASASSQVIEELSPVTLVNLSNHSDWLFPRSNLPAVVLFARHRPLRHDTITTVQVPWTPAGSKSHTFEIARSDIITFSMADWKQKPEYLKTAFVGSRRDLSLMDRLMTNHLTLRDRLDALGTKLSVGLTIGTNRSRDASHLHGLPLLRPKDLRPFSVAALDRFYSERAQWPRERKTYQAPLLLVNENLRRDPRPVAAVIYQDIVYTDAVIGAALPVDEVETLHLLAAIMSSSLASWFFLMSSSSFGLWKPRIKLGDIERLPIPVIKEALNSEAGRHLVNIVRDLQKGFPSDSDWQKLDEAVFDLYDMDEADRIVARDGLFRASWQWMDGRNASVKPANVSQVLEYANTFQEAVGVWLSATNQRRMRAEVFDLPEHAPLRVVRFVLEECSDLPEHSGLEVLNPDGDLRDVLNRIGEHLDVPLAKSLVGQRELRVHGHDEVVIIKPAARRHWMGVSALEDADSVIAECLNGTTI